MLILGFLTLGVFLLGQGGEDFVEDLAGVSHDAIEEHEKMGFVSLAAVAATGTLSLFGLIFYKGFSLFRRERTDAANTSAEPLGEESHVKRNSLFPRWLIFAVLLLALLSSGVLGYTGKLGGKIRHTEFYGGATEAEEENGKKRRGKTDENNAVNTDSETKETTESDTQEKDTENGKGRGRNRGGRK